VNDDELLGRYYREADLFCLPSHDEGFPRVLYEAMLHGTPIVTTFVGSISSVMEDSLNCLRVDVRSPVALADTIERTLRSPDLRKRLSDNGYATMEPILRRMKAGNHAKQVFCKATAHRAKGKERP
jgi:glycosyltransferase involved in cell wall biosynthesis